jgi:hypothetical protein
MATLAMAGAIGFSTPAHACVVQGGPLSGRSCTFAVDCAVGFSDHHNPDLFRACLDVV